MSGSSEERLARVALSLLLEPGDERWARVVRERGPEQVRARIAADASPDGAEAARRLATIDPALALRRAEERGYRFVAPGEDEWPQVFSDLAHIEGLVRRGGEPLGLWLKGPARLDEVAQSAVAVVGSRSATTYGAQVAGDLAHGLATAGRVVVSGGAFGIDQAAHRGALAAGKPTVVVLACGVDRVYPSAHAQLIGHVGETGLLIAESPPGSHPTRIRFLSRNRLIAALGAGTVVVEAAIRSGALNTANWASRLGRAVMGVPGSVHSAPSVGVHELIRSRDALLVTCASDVLEVVSAVGAHLPEPLREPPRPHDHLDVVDLHLLDAVPAITPVPAAKIAETAGVSLRALEEALPRLAADGLVVRTGSGWARRSRQP